MEGRKWEGFPQQGKAASESVLPFSSGGLEGVAAPPSWEAAGKPPKMLALAALPTLGRVCAPPAILVVLR